jgi:hypothetical protein
MPEVVILSVDDIAGDETLSAADAANPQRARAAVESIARDFVGIDVLKVDSEVVGRGSWWLTNLAGQRVLIVGPSADDPGDSRSIDSISTTFTDDGVPQNGTVHPPLQLHCSVAEDAHARAQLDQLRTTVDASLQVVRGYLANDLEGRRIAPGSSFTVGSSTFSGCRFLSGQLGRRCSTMVRGG